MSVDHAEIPVVVLNWNGWDDTVECVRSLIREGYASNVWVVDNGSEVDRSDEVLALDPRVRIIENGANLGWAGGYNRAIALALDEGLDYLYLLNNDTEVRPGFLKNLVDEAPAEFAAIASTVLYGDDVVYYDGTYCRHEGKTVEDLPGGLREAEHLYGAGFLISLRACKEHGLFDERFFCYREEAEWASRVRRRGERVLVSADSLIHHKVSGSDVSHNSLYYMTRNKYIDYHDVDGYDGPVAISALVNLRHEIDKLTLGDLARSRAILHGFSDGVTKTYGQREPGGKISPYVLASLAAWVPREVARRLYNKIRG